MRKLFCLLMMLWLTAVSYAQIPSPVLHPFVHGVASGDPLSDSVIIWTRISDQTQPTAVNWSMATDTMMTQVVQSGSFTTDSTMDYTVKVDVTGLTPDTWYYYQFEHDGRKSLIGRTKTFPTGEVDHQRFAIASCSRVNANAYYNSYLDIARRNDLQAVIHVGDYIYETNGSVTGHGVQILPTGEARTLSDYRNRYNTYKLDPDLQRVHQQYPFINVWDDHETANDSWEGGAEAHDPNAEGPWETRKRGGQQAYFEWLPIRPHATDSFRIYRSFELGDLAEIIMIDSRLEGRDEQASTLDQNAYADTNRTILGVEQRDWLLDKLSTSTAKWKIIGNQVMFAPLQLFGVYFSYEQWDGYQGDRNRIIDHVMDNDIENIVVVTGDIHTSWANDVPIEGANYNPNNGNGSAFVEFIGPSITTGSDMNVPQAIINAANPHIKYTELTQDGYFTLDIDSGRAQADWYYVSSIFDPNFTVSNPAHWKVNCDERFLQQASGSAVGFENEVPFAPLGVDNPPIDVSIITVEKPFQLINVYPNPFQETITIEWNALSPKEYSFTLLASDGAQHDFGPFSSVVGKNSRQISLTKLAAGSYYLLVKDGHEIIQKRALLKQ